MLFNVVPGGEFADHGTRRFAAFHASIMNDSLPSSAWTHPLRASTLALGAAALSVLAPQADAASISYSFVRTPATEALDSTTPKGPLATSVWNDSAVVSTGTQAAGTETALVNSAGSATGAQISWTSANVWSNASGTASEDAKVVVGYLDDGGTGVLVNLTNIPFAKYNVYGILGSDQTATTYTTRDFQINGTTWAIGGTAAATGTAFSNFGAGSANGTWTRILAGGAAGNYWEVDGLSGSTLSIQGQIRATTQRASLSAIIIQEVLVPEPSAMMLGGAAVLGLAGRRRRPRR